MTKNRLHITARIIIILLAFAQGACSQSQVSVKATLNRKQILIGEPIQLTLEATVPENAALSWFPPDSIPHFEYVEKGKIDSLVSGHGISFRQDVLVTSFDSGTWVFPPLALVVNGTTYLTDSAKIEVSFSKFNPNQDYHDIKDIVEVADPDAKYIMWVIAAFTILSIVAVAWFIQKSGKEKTMVKEVVSKLSPYEEAVKSLAGLKQKQLPQKGEVKLYYTELNDILRQFVLRRLGISSMVKTNDELILQLKQQNISAEQFSRLAQALRMSDFVKFAKYVPDQNDNEQNFSIIQSSVDLLNAIDK